MELKEKKLLISKFVENVKLKFEDLGVECFYDEELDLFRVLHDAQEREFGDDEFNIEIGQMIKDILYKNDVFNFSFVYDCYNEMTQNKNPYVLEESQEHEYKIEVDSEIMPIVLSYSFLEDIKISFNVAKKISINASYCRSEDNVDNKVIDNNKSYNKLDNSYCMDTTYPDEEGGLAA